MTDKEMAQLQAESDAAGITLLSADKRRREAERALLDARDRVETAQQNYMDTEKEYEQAYDANIDARIRFLRARLTQTSPTPDSKAEEPTSVGQFPVGVGSRS